MKKYTFREQITGFPWSQMLILAAIRFAEPISFTSLFPYVYFMVRSFHEGKDEHLIARYAGYISGAFAFAQVLTGIAWGRFSDRHGRKPVVLIGMTGSIISLLIFGFSTNFYMAVGARVLAGLLNGNVSVIRTIIGEIATKRQHQPIAFTTMPLLWQIGCIIGPMIGGYLADPVASHPEWFTPGGILEGKPEQLFTKYRFLLPNLVVCSILFCGLVGAFLFLEETHEIKKHRFDLGTHLAKKLIKFLFFWRRTVGPEKDTKTIQETTSLLAGSNQAESDDDDPSKAVVVEEDIDESWNAILVPRVNSILMASFFLAQHTIVFEELLPIFLCSKIVNDSRLPFAGGLGLDASEMGSLLSSTGFTGILMMMVVYPWLDREFGTLRSFRWILRGHPIIYFFTPFLLFLKRIDSQWVFPCLLLFVSIRTVFSSLNSPGLFLLVNRAVAHKRHLSTVNGTQQVVSSLARAVGPIIWGYFMAFGEATGHVELPWWLLGGFAFVGALHGCLYVKDGDERGEEERE